eukprot:536202_1
MSIETEKEKQSATKLRFIQMFIDLFDENEKINDYEKGLEIVKKFCIVYEFLDRDLSFYLKNHILTTPKYPELIEYHKTTEFKVEKPRNGLLYVFGEGTDGQLGLGDDIKQCSMPQISDILNEGDLIQVAAGEYHTLCIDRNHRVFGCGFNRTGQLGLGHKNKTVMTPQLIPSFTKYKAIQIAAGQSHSLVLTEDGNVWSFGYNNQGQLGHANQKTNSTPTIIEALKDEHIVQISSGSFHSAVISQKGNLFCFGNNGYGQCGLGDNWNADILIPKKVDINKEYKEEKEPLIPSYVDCGGNHTLLLTENNFVMSWGLGNNGQLGYKAEKQKQATPKIIDVLSNKKIVKIACGGNHNLCVSEQGELYSFGAGIAGQLGFGTKKNVFEPQRVELFIKQNIQIVSCFAGTCGYHSAVIGSNGNCWLFGGNLKGQLGNGTKESKLLPAKINIKATSISLGGSHSVVIGNDDKRYEDGLDDPIYLKQDQQIKITTKKAYRLFIKNEEIFGQSDWRVLSNSKTEKN